MSQSTNIETPWSHWHNQLHKALKIKPHLLPSEASLLLSVSGGQDSMALLKLIADLRRLYKWEIHIWHGNHGWHRDSEKIAKELESWCLSHSFSFTCQSASKEQVKNEESSRQWRYESLALTANKLFNKKNNCSYKYVLTGHTASDQAETFIFNLARGTYLSGLSSLRESRILEDSIKLIRPLLIFTRKETAEICKDLNLPIWIDPTNSDLTLSRNRIREKVIPILEEIHPGSCKRIASLTERISHIKENEDCLIDLALGKINVGEKISRISIKKLPFQTRVIIIAKWLRISGAPTISASQLEEISNLIKENMPSGERKLSKGWIIKWDKNSIELVK